MTTVHGTGTGRAPGVEGELQVSSLTFKSFNNQIDQPSTHWQCSPHPGQKAVWRTGTSHSQDWIVAHWNQRSPPCHRVSHSLCSHQGSQVPSLPGQTLPTPPLSAQSHPNRILLHPPASSHCNHPPDTVFSTELCWLWPTYKNEQVSAIKTNLLQKKYIGPKPQVKLSKVLKLFCQKKNTTRSESAHFRGQSRFSAVKMTNRKRDLAKKKWKSSPVRIWKVIKIVDWSWTVRCVKDYVLIGPPQYLAPHPPSSSGLDWPPPWKFKINPQLRINHLLLAGVILLLLEPGLGLGSGLLL